MLKESQLGVCRLCLQQRELQLSHIKPEFVYGSLYDEKHRLDVFDLERGAQPRDITPARKPQKGVREPLLCKECEGRFNRWETYTSELLYGRPKGTGILSTRTSSVPVDSASLKLFVMSVVWRASVSSEPFFQYVKLGPTHEERLRVMLLSADPGAPIDYGITIVMESALPFELVEQAMVSPECIRQGSERFCRLMMAGLFWLVRVSSHRGDWTARQEKFLSLRNDGTLRIYKGNEGTTELLLEMFGAGVATGKQNADRSMKRVL
jgi:hypothetical protein